MNMSRVISSIFALLAMTVMAGCRSWLVDSADRQVYDLVTRRQLAALGEPHDARVGDEKGRIDASSRMYGFLPSAIGAALPEPFQSRANAAGGARAVPEPSPGQGAAPAEAPPDEGPTSEMDGGGKTADAAPEGRPPPPDDASGQGRPDGGGDGAVPPAPPDREPEPVAVVPMGIKDVLAYAMRHSRELQDAKEDLYLAALDLTLERHLWTPQLVASMRAEFADFGQIRDFDRAMTTVSDVAVSQRLPLGGQVSARIINSLMRDLGAHATSGESGTFIMDANIPLFRGAGRVAYESRYQAERAMIYAVRAYERFRRRFLVDIASDYFALQQNKSRISNAEQNRESADDTAKRAQFQFNLKRQDIFEKARAQSTLRQAETDVQNEEESYQSALDQFKIRLAMPIEEPLDVVAQEDDRESRALEDLLPELSEQTALDVALRYRLDYLTVKDRVDDARRGVVIAENLVLPDLDFTGSMTMDTNPNTLNSTGFNTERTTWRGMLELRMDDRKTERNAYRASLITLRRAERAADEFGDRVRSDVRRAMRRIVQSLSNREIQRLSVEENEQRLDAAEKMVLLGQRTNQDQVDAQNDLQRARNLLAAAEAGVRRAILEFRRDTGTLRVADDGDWTPGQPPVPPPEPRPPGP